MAAASEEDVAAVVSVVVIAVEEAAADVVVVAEVAERETGIVPTQNVEITTLLGGMNAIGVNVLKREAQVVAMEATEVDVVVAVDSVAIEEDEVVVLEVEVVAVEVVEDSVAIEEDVADVDDLDPIRKLGSRQTHYIVHRLFTNITQLWIWTSPLP